MTKRTDAKIAGVAYLCYIMAAMSSAVLSARTTVGSNVSEVLSTLGTMTGLARVTVLLDLLQIICAIVLAVTLYQLVRGVDATLALLAMLFRVGESLLGFFPLLDKLELMQIAATPAIRASPVPDPALVEEILHRPDNGFSEFCFVVGGFLFAWLFVQGHLIPRWLAWTGVVTIGVQLLFVPLQIATIIPATVVNWLWFPILLYEVPLAFWLIAKGTEDARPEGKVASTM